MKKGYKVTIIVFISIFALFMVYMFGFSEAKVRSYHIKDFVIDVTMKDNGDIQVKEDTIYKFNGDYNGITITIPTNVSEDYYNRLTRDSMNDSKKLPDSLYISNGIENVKIYVVDNGTNRYFEKVGNASIGDKGVYTVSEEDGLTTYTIYEPSSSENKQIVIEYTLKDVMVQHNDCMELFWNFVGGEVECEIKNLRINLHGQNILKAYTHGNSTSNITTNSYFTTVKYKNVQPGEFVSVRVAQDTYYNKAKKNTNLTALPIIETLEESYQSKKDAVIGLRTVAIIMTVAIFVYWIILLVRFEKEIEPVSLVFDDIDILDKYNPMIAACIAQNRGMHPRDILAVLIDLVNIKALTMVHIRGNVIGAKSDLYRLKKNKDFFNDKDKLKSLDEIQQSVLNIFFGEEEEIELTKRLKDIEHAPSMVEELKTLDSKVALKLGSLGANYESVPKALRVFNTVVFIIVCIFIVAMLAYNISLRYVTLSVTGVAWYIVLPSMMQIAVLAIFGILPLFTVIVKIVVNIVNYVRRKVSKIAFKLTTKKLTRRMVIITIIFTAIILFEVFVIKDVTVLIATTLFLVALLVILTDNLMTQHLVEIQKEYVMLKLLQDKIENGSLLEEKNIQDNILWSRYFTFAVALGVGNVAEFVKQIPDFSSMESIVESFYSVTDGGFMLYNSDRELYVKTRLQRFNTRMDNFTKSFMSHSGSGGSFGGRSRGFSSGGGRFSGGGGRRGGRGAF